MSKRESKFERETVKELKNMFPGCRIHKMDCQDCQGVPDRLILYKKHWALLEFKRYKDAHHQPNQDYYIDIYNKMSYAAFIYPENKEKILYELQQAFRVRR